MTIVRIEETILSDPSKSIVFVLQVIEQYSILLHLLNYAVDQVTLVEKIMADFYVLNSLNFEDRAEGKWSELVSHPGSSAKQSQQDFSHIWCSISKVRIIVCLKFYHICFLIGFKKDVIQYFSSKLEFGLFTENFLKRINFSSQKILEMMPAVS